MDTTVGQILINEALPEQHRDYSRVMDKKGVQELLTKIADEGNSEAYRDLVLSLYKLGYEASHTSGASLSLAALKTPPKTAHLLKNLNDRVISIVNTSGLSDEDRSKLIKDEVSKAQPVIEDTVYNEALAANNPFAIQVISGSRGSKGDMQSILAGDLLVTDKDNKLVGMPLLRGYGRGLDPAEYWAGAYGSRRGVIGTKMITMHAGFAGKQLIQAAHRGVVTEDDCKTSRGIPVRANDPDNVGTVLSVDAGPFKAGQIIDARVMQQLGDVDILVRSPLTCEAGGGVCAHCVGIRESGALPSIGDNVGVAAAQALAERLSQSSLGSKHIAGRMQKGHDEEALTGFKLINQLMQVPKAFQGGAAVATIDGSIKEIKDAPQGGKYIVIGDVEHYVPQGQTVSVKAGARVEEGDILSSGLPNPADLVRHRGIGAGRAAFVDEFRKAFMTSGLTANRRNIELVTRGLINHIEVNDADGIDGGLPGDIMEYNAVERSYTPRHGAQDLSVKDASGKYLEQPYLHYSIGTRITPSVVKTLNKYGINQVSVHNDQPSFTPHMLRAMDISRHDPNWQTRLGGWYLESSLLDALHSDVPSAEHDTSFIPAVAKGTEFGKDLATKGVY